MKRRLGMAICGAAFIAILLLSSARVHHFRENLPSEQLRAEALMVDPTLLKVISGEFKGLMADYLNLKVAVFKGGSQETTPEDWMAIATLFKQAIELDPYFFHTAYYTQGIMSWREGLQQEAIDILEISAHYRSWDWEPLFYAGFDYFFYLKDVQKAADAFRQSAMRPGASPIAAFLAARLSQRSGQTLSAIALLKTMLEQSKDEPTKELYSKRLEAYLGVHQLEGAIETFLQIHGHRPDTLESLVTTGILPALPKNPFGDHFIYEPDTGKVFFDAVR